jgi:hypothetical protein
MRINVAVLVTLGLIVFASQAQAYEIKTGLIKKITINSPPMSGRNIILELDGVATMCSIQTNNQSAYLNKADAPDTFAAYVSALLTAQASGRPIVVHTISGAEGCRIDQLHLAY